jgi:hypothetical protein
VVITIGITAIQDGGERAKDTVTITGALLLQSKIFLQALLNCLPCKYYQMEIFYRAFLDAKRLGTTVTLHSFIS